MSNNNNNNNSSNNQAGEHLQDKDEVIHNLREQVEQTKHSRIDQNPPLLKTNDYNYKLEDKNEQRHPHGFVEKMRKKLAPVRAWIQRVHFRLEDSSRTRRRWIFGGLSLGAFVLLLIGVFWTKGLIISNTQPGHPKQFINGDTVQITNEEYDPHTQMALAFLTTNSKTSAVNPGDLSAGFRFDKSPKTYHVPTPTIQLLPIYQNHFVAVMRNVYPGFRALSIKLLDHNHISAEELGSMISQTNGLPKGSNQYKKPNDGAYCLSKYQEELVSADTSQLDIKHAQEQEALLKKIHDNNTQYLVLSEAYLQHNETHINRIQSGKQILNRIFHDVVINNQKDIKLRQSLIRRNNKLLQQDRRKIRSLYKHSNINNNDPQITQTQNEMSHIKSSNSKFNNEISLDTKALQQARDHWNQLNNGTMKLPAPQAQNPAEHWGDGED